MQALQLSLHITGFRIPEQYTSNDFNLSPHLCYHIVKESICTSLACVPECFEACQTDLSCRTVHHTTPRHTARVVKQWLQHCQVHYIEGWPGNSPDLNPIKYLCSIIKRELRQHDTLHSTRDRSCATSVAEY